MSDQNGQLVAGRAAKVCNERGRRLVIQVRCGLIEQQDVRLGKQGSRDRQPLPLTAGQARALGADARVETRRKRIEQRPEANASDDLV